MQAPNAAGELAPQDTAAQLLIQDQLNALPWLSNARVVRWARTDVSDQQSTVLISLLVREPRDVLLVHGNLLVTSEVPTECWFGQSEDLRWKKH
jgi:hypothetical protein